MSMFVQKSIYQMKEMDIFESNVNIWNVNCARATAFIFDTRTGVLMKVSKFLSQKISRPEGDSNPPTFFFMSNALTIWAIRAKHLLSKVFYTDSGGIDIFWSIVNIWNVNTLRPWQNARHFADDIFKCIFLNENIWISINI